MGIQLSVSTIKMMKSIFFACLVAAVYAEAEPKAEADAFYGYNGLVGGYTGYALPAYTTGYANYGYAGLNAGHYIGKREAEAEPEADAYYGTYGYNGLSGLGYSGLGYGYASTYAAAPVARTYAAAPLVRSYAAAPIAR